MGLDLTTAKFILERNVNWIRTLTIGRQNWWLSRRESASVGCPIARYSRTNYSEPFFRMLGALTLESVDLSPDESPTFTADLSVPKALGYRKYSCICDFGTAEHIADQGVYWRNIWEALDPLGHLIVVVPANQLCGHGLYQFSPEFFARIGGFSHRRIELVEYGWSIKRGEFCKSGRFEARHQRPTFVFAHIVKDIEIPFSMPIQSCNAQTTHLKQWNEGITGFLLDLPLVRRIQRSL